MPNGVQNYKKNLKSASFLKDFYEIIHKFLHTWKIFCNFAGDFEWVGANVATTQLFRIIEQLEIQPVPKWN